MITLKETEVSKFGLIGRDIGYSFSKSFFTEKFEREHLSHSYENFDIPSIADFEKVIAKNTDLKGLNVTIPYKESVIPFLDEMDETAKTIGAVNVIKFLEDGRLKGFNSDYYGFQKALSKYLPLKKKTALILGTGGASKAIAFALHNLGFRFQYISRTGNDTFLDYAQLNEKILAENLLIINCTPLGTSPNISSCPPIPYQFLSSDHLLFDLIYNPAETEFMNRGKNRGARTTNGLAMLELQAEKAWEIWNV